MKIYNTTWTPPRWAGWIVIVLAVVMVYWAGAITGWKIGWGECYAEFVTDQTEPPVKE